MDCAILSLQSALEKVNSPDTLAALRLQHPNASEETLLENLAKARADYEDAIELLQACNALTILDEEEEIALEMSQNRSPEELN